MNEACLDRVGSTTCHNDRNYLGRIHNRLDKSIPSRYHDEVNLETHQFGSKRGKPLALSVGVSVLDGDVLSLDVIEFAQTLAKGLDAG